MDHFNKLKRQVQGFIFILLLACTSLVIFGGWVIRNYFPGYDTQVSLTLLAISIVIILIVSHIVADYALKPLDFVWKAVLHISPKGTNNAPPNLEKNNVGQELVNSLTLQVYEAARKANPPEKNVDDITKRISDNLPLPTIAMNQKAEVVYVNDAALHYMNLKKEDVLGQHLGGHINLDFPDDNTFSAWLVSCRQNRVTATNTWQRVRVHTDDDQANIKQFDMAAYYSKDSSGGVETILTLFDRSEIYAQDDDGLGFVALAVHELRTPLTMLRGYIEVFEDELTDQLNPEMKSFMYKMNASSQQLAAFVNNILNVARVEGNQLSLRLTEENWPAILKGAIQDIKLRVKVHQKVVSWEIAPNVPTVAVDHVSIYEVIANLIDNAVKYSGKSKQIIIKTYVGQDGMVETTVQDFGVGIPATVVPHLFEKFQRNHRNRAQIGGTGLGLYLSKAIITAHGGNIWVTSKEGEGSTFGFTLQPYERLADELKTNNNQGIERTAHGWIKNHSMYRR
jgi:two-component system sensor histidine kinase VicK